MTTRVWCPVQHAGPCGVGQLASAVQSAAVGAAPRRPLADARAPPLAGEKSCFSARRSSLAVAPYLSPSLAISPYLSLSLPVYPRLSPSLPGSLPVSPCLSPSLAISPRLSPYLSLSLATSRHISPYLPISRRRPLQLTMNHVFTPHSPQATTPWGAAAKCGTLLYTYEARG